MRTSSNAVTIVDSRSTTKGRELVKSKSSRPRDILSNITNKRPSELNLISKKTGSKSQRKLLKSANKRPSALLENEPSALKTKTKSLKKIKKRKSDPMILDTEETRDSVANLPSLQYEDIDEKDYGDPQSVAEYVTDIYNYLMEKEKDSVDPYYLNNQLEINEKMRAVLIDWLVEVHRMFKLIPETLFLCVSLIDRYLSITQVSRDTLQLLGVTAMFIAAKYEEIYAPECMDFVYVSDGACTKHQILKMEQTLLNTLQFNITHPTPVHFLRRYSKAAGSDYMLHTLCKYLIEVSLLDVNLLKYAPSLISASAVYLGRAMVGKTPLWTPTLEHYTTYKEHQVRECANLVNMFLKKSQKSSLKSVRVKYSNEKFGKVAEIATVEVINEGTV
jgi:cyclin B